MNFTSVKYALGRLSSDENAPLENASIIAVIDGKTWHIPLDPANRHYQAIQEWVKEGNKIEDAD